MNLSARAASSSTGGMMNEKYATQMFCRTKNTGLRAGVSERRVKPSEACNEKKSALC